MEKVAELVTLDTLPIIDKQDGLRLAGQNQNLANEILGMFIEELSIEIPAFQTLFAANDLTELQRRLHKLHGGCCYTGTPRLKACLYHLETCFKTNQLTLLADQLNQLTNEANLLIKQYAEIATKH